MDKLASTSVTSLSSLSSGPVSSTQTAIVLPTLQRKRKREGGPYNVKDDLVYTPLVQTRPFYMLADIAVNEPESHLRHRLLTSAMGPTTAEWLHAADLRIILKRQTHYYVTFCDSLRTCKTLDELRVLADKIGKTNLNFPPDVLSTSNGNLLSALTDFQIVSSGKTDHEQREEKQLVLQIFDGATSRCPALVNHYAVASVIQADRRTYLLEKMFHCNVMAFTFSSVVRPWFGPFALAVDKRAHCSIATLTQLNLYPRYEDRLTAIRLACFWKDIFILQCFTCPNWNANANGTLLPFVDVDSQTLYEEIIAFQNDQHRQSWSAVANGTSVADCARFRRVAQPRSQYYDDRVADAEYNKQAAAVDRWIVQHRAVYQQYASTYLCRLLNVLLDGSLGLFHIVRTYVGWNVD